MTYKHCILFILCVNENIPLFLTTQQESTEVTATELTTGTTTLSNSVTTPSPLWLKETLQNIAYYLRAHKFNEYDRRYRTENEKIYYSSFPRPPLRSLHWEVHKYCDTSLIACITYLKKRILNTSLRRNDDTSVVIQDQKWTHDSNRKQIEVVDKECQIMRKQDEKYFEPFEGPLERYQWRVTASYFMCWYTMLSEIPLTHLSEHCDNFAQCLNIEYGANNHDIRANDSIPFECALYSFCPDPCCPVKHLTQSETCWNAPENPCFEDNPLNKRKCNIVRSQNTDLKDIILNRWNVSCSCTKEGFVWSSTFGFCVDVDECAFGSHNCDPTEVCFNTPGGFKCLCQWGHIHNAKTQKCEVSRTLSKVMSRVDMGEDTIENDTLWTKLLKYFGINTEKHDE